MSSLPALHDSHNHVCGIQRMLLYTRSYITTLRYVQLSSRISSSSYGTGRSIIDRRRIEFLTRADLRSAHVIDRRIHKIINRKHAKTSTCCSIMRNISLHSLIYVGFLCWHLHLFLLSSSSVAQAHSRNQTVGGIGSTVSTSIAGAAFMRRTLQANTTTSTNTATTFSATSAVATVKALYFNDSILGLSTRSFHNAELHPFIEPTSLFEYIKRDVVEMLEWGCLYGTNQPHHSENKWADMDYNRSEALADWQFLRGSTIWINEHMAVGHMMYDVFIIQLFQTVPIDRIVLQRAPCMNADLCLGTGSWGSFYEGFYTAMIDAFQPGVPIYIRWTWQDKEAKPIYLDGRDATGYVVNPPKPKPEKIVLNGCKCFERVYRRRCMQCFHHGISISAIRKFKQSAYNLVNKKLLGGRDANKTKIDTLDSHFHSITGPIVVTLSYRVAPASRHIRNAQTLISNLRDALSPSSTSAEPTFIFRTHVSSNISITYRDQMELVARSHIVISEHGAFQSNIIYMKKSSLFIEMRGSYGHGEFVNFEKIANMFEVHYAHVTTKALTSHKDAAFDISVEECGEIIDVVREYAKQAPWKHNVVKK